MKTFIGVLIVVVVIVGGVLYYNRSIDQQVVENTIQDQNPPANESGNTSDEHMDMGPMKYALAALSGSGQAGIVSFMAAENNKVQVEIRVSNAPKGSKEPAHIHEGACPTPGKVLYPLSDVVDGSSVTTLDVSMDELLKKVPFAVNVHKSASALSSYVACGDVKNDNAMSSDEMMQGGAMGGSMMDAAKSFEVSGKDFEFSVKEIRVKKGEKVTINFTSSQGFHDWVVDEFNAKTKQVSTGGKTSVTFTADKAGTFEYYCSVGKHRQNGMVGKLIVE